VCERLNLPLAPNGGSHMNALGEAHTNGDKSRHNRSKPRKR
jgi:hypothetical protein